MIEGTEEVGSRRDSLPAGSINDSDTKTDLLTTDPEGEYILDETFLRLIEEHSLSLYQDQRSNWKVIS